MAHRLLFPSSSSSSSSTYYTDRLQAAEDEMEAYAARDRFEADARLALQASNFEPFLRHLIVQPYMLPPPALTHRAEPIDLSPSPTLAPRERSAKLVQSRSLGDRWWWLYQQLTTGDIGRSVLSEDLNNTGAIGGSLRSEATHRTAESRRSMIIEAFTTMGIADHDRHDVFVQLAAKYRVRAPEAEEWCHAHLGDLKVVEALINTALNLAMAAYDVEEQMAKERANLLHTIGPRKDIPSPSDPETVAPAPRVSVVQQLPDFSKDDIRRLTILLAKVAELPTSDHSEGQTLRNRKIHSMFSGPGLSSDLQEKLRVGVKAMFDSGVRKPYSKMLEDVANAAIKSAKAPLLNCLASIKKLEKDVFDHQLLSLTDQRTDRRTAVNTMVIALEIIGGKLHSLDASRAMIRRFQILSRNIEFLRPKAAQQLPTQSRPSGASATRKTSRVSTSTSDLRAISSTRQPLKMSREKPPFSTQRLGVRHFLQRFTEPIKQPHKNAQLRSRSLKDR